MGNRCTSGQSDEIGLPILFLVWQAYLRNEGTAMISAIFGHCFIWRLWTADVVMSRFGGGGKLVALLHAFAAGLSTSFGFFEKDRLSRGVQDAPTETCERRFYAGHLLSTWAVGTKKPAAYYWGLSRPLIGISGIGCA